MKRFVAVTALFGGGRERPRTHFRGAGTVAFDVFVSYSHSVDGELAPAVQRALHRLAKPWYRARALHVFRDESTLSANPHLWSSIQTAMDESDWFVLLASPEAAVSEWVNRELEYWLATKATERILVVHTAGTWEWNADARALRGDAVPAALRDAFSDEPRHVDLRWVQSETDLDMHNARFRDAIAQLAAPVHGIAKDELESEDVRLHRRARRLARGGVSVLALLVVIALVTTGVAVVERNDATTQRDRASRDSARAERAANLATAERLAAVSVSHRGGDESQALLLAVEGYQRADSVATRSALLGTLMAAPQLVGFMPGPRDTTASAISPDGRIIAAGTKDGSLRFWKPRDFADRTTTVAPLAALRGVPVIRLAFDRDGKRLFVLHHDGHVEQWDPTTRSPVGAPMAVGSPGSAALSVSPNGGEIVVGAPPSSGRSDRAFGSTEPGATVYDVERRRVLGSLPGALNAIFSPDASTVFTSGGGLPLDGGLHAYDAHTFQPSTALPQPRGGSDTCLAGSCYSTLGGYVDLAAATSPGSFRLTLSHRQGALVQRTLLRPVRTAHPG